MRIDDFITYSHDGDKLIQQLKLVEVAEEPYTLSMILEAKFFRQHMGKLYLYILDKLSLFKFKNYPLVDLGTGGQSEIIWFANNLHVPGLVAVDCDRQFQPDIFKEDEQPKIPVLGIKMDMVRFLQSLPDNSVNVSMFGIDDIILPNIYTRDLLFKELKRVVPDDGLIFADDVTAFGIVGLGNHIFDSKLNVLNS